jgi:tRNA threonylcarbamoyladenosine biosynthesis protein TsaB
MQDYAYLLAIDTCGPTGSVALGQQVYGAFHVLGESQFDGRRSSDSVVGSVCELLGMAEVQLQQLSAIVAVNGPGGFTGVRVGLSAVKGLAESSEIPVTTVSRLEVLADKAGIPSAALDAHRGEVFLRLELPVGQARELLAGAQELSSVDIAPRRIAVCDEAAAALLAAVWPAAELVRASPPSAADALRFGVARVDAGEFVDVALLDGHYLRRSDAEIFGPESLGRPDAKGPRDA